mgnify:CR=1 FL=1
MEMITTNMIDENKEEFKAISNPWREDEMHILEQPI